MNSLHLPAQCLARSVSELHAAFVEAFRTREEVEIDGAHVEDVDLTLIQLLVSAAKTSMAVQKPMRLIAVSEPLRVAIARAGLRLSLSGDQIAWA